MSTMTQNQGFDSNYTSKYKFSLPKEDDSACWFCVTWGSQSKVFDLPKGYVSQLFPETITDNVKAEWQSTNILNRVGKLWSYGGTSDREISFSFDISKDAWATDDTASPQFDEFIGGLRSCAYPYYGTNVMYPPIVVFQFGKFRAKGIVSSVSLTWKKPIIENGYSVVTVSISMTDLAGKVVNQSEILKAGYLNPFSVK